MNPYYFDRYSWPIKYIHTPPPSDLKLAVVIPSYKEPDLMKTLASLHECDSWNEGSIEILVIINEPEYEDESVKDLHHATMHQCKHATDEWGRSDVYFHFIYARDLPGKDFGVGLARKIGMDQAARRFAAIDQSEGVIACLDADCTVKKNYLQELLKFFEHKASPGCSIYFEHPINNEKILKYELHLRYYIHAQRFAGFRNAFQTVGSSIAVRAEAYTRQGGMNKRKAGEDFYFIHKIISLGGFMELKNTCVYPSNRVSDRVPFGTGRAMGDSDYQGLTYNPKSFQDLKEFLISRDQLFEEDMKQGFFPDTVYEFLQRGKVLERIYKLRTNSKDAASFTKRFLSVFDAFQVMKYLHFARDHYYSDVPVEEASRWLIQEHFGDDVPEDLEGTLVYLRKVDSSNRA